MTKTTPRQSEGLASSEQASQSSPTETILSPDALRLKEVMDRLSPSVFVGLLTVEGNLVHANRAALDAIGVTLGDVIDTPFEKTPWWTFSDSATLRLRSAIKDAANGIASRFDVHVQDRHGRVLTMDFSLEPLYGADGKVEYLIPSARDVSEGKAAEQRVLYLASHDDLTGLPNRNLFGERLRQAVDHADCSGERLAVLVLDLDRFGIINNALGQHGGDEVLRAATNRLAACVRSSDTLARLGSDEFGFILCGDHADFSRIAGEAQRIADTFAQPLVVAGREVYLTCSIGGVARADSIVSEDQLFKSACSALNTARNRGGNLAHFYSLETAPQDAEWLDLESALRGAIKRDELSLHYQPQVDLRTGAIVGAEALMRWQRPDRSMISPVRFIPIAEKTGLILPLGMWALQSALGEIKHLRDQGLPIKHVSVNLSARQLHQQDLIPKVEELLRQADIEPGSLTLELTESLLLEDAEHAARTLKSLKALGLKLSLDDFGTGYSSLAYLHRFPFDTLKIDRSFVQEMHTQSNGAAIVDATIQLAHSLGMTVVAEGVECEQQLIALRSSGCDYVQGYVFSQPLQIVELTSMLRDRPVFTMPPNNTAQGTP